MRKRVNLAVWTAIVVLFYAQIPSANAWDEWEEEESVVDENTPNESPPEEVEEEVEEEDNEAERILEEYRADGRRIYLICFFGERDNGIVTRKCRQVERELEQTYGARWVTRLNNPTQAQLERIQRRVGRDIGAVLIVTHSTPENEERDEFDVWDCPMEPDDIADIFEDEWVIWNGCYSVSICELADNLLPTQCEDGVLSSNDDTWRDILRCLERNRNTPRNRDEICEQVFGDRWNPEDDQP